MTWSADLAPVVDDVLSATPPERLWETVVALDWTTVGVDETAGGAGGDVRDQAELAGGAGRHAIGIPLWETAHAAWAMTRAGLELPERGQPAVVVTDPSRAVAWGDHDTVVLLVHADSLMRVPARCRIAPDSATLAGEPAGLLDRDAAAPGDIGGVSLDTALAEEIRGRGALLRAAALHGAMHSACELTREHVQSREQFGRPLASHQAVAHALATMVLERDRVRAGIDEALDRGGPGPAEAARAAAAAAAGQVASAAHQLLGAMGTTREHSLHHFTRRLWSWRDADGSQHTWERRVGELALAGDDDDALWSLVTG
ncbi:acyl-CoA dehydrogenase family protein [Nocardioides sp. SOB44]|uniref:Acyl-CoA dehydrogenase family protein n=1 Tax=Nocardioides cremeus TaxID=3058044 RepID=A0ABT8TN68_9ACTN|nr:acyl-CoA dehydrogenase family protein [Nocardioides cremeus]MDO3395404.1 acyl-CoA dehydrogenase family protein [Nocardioides cremeus]